MPELGPGPPSPPDKAWALSDNLVTRQALPEAFRYLEAVYPRAQWPALEIHPTARHWLEVHDWFRGQMTALGEIGALWREGRIEAADYRGAATPRLRQMLTHLHHHHERETRQAFPLLTAAEPRMTEGFALLDRDHDQIEALLAGMADDANALLRAGATTDLRPLAGALADRVERGTRLINRHLWDEEEIVVPVLTLRGDQLAI
ncbi:hemerythrin domain-containing protein [Brevundimonas sp. M20]|uniref:hemerythrin domain-containing protein n=1 Tax=Brevundimonas sp. M20 TaxID=2591463 RepID=UPI0011475E0E|nr:hemerythrin domain-containing protein [Brevundimonas sp. M20]QDH73530.1 hemerythrin domain-containing protein [Brevundimonas sp. M20]